MRNFDVRKDWRAGQILIFGRILKKSFPAECRTKINGSASMSGRDCRWHNLYIHSTNRVFDSLVGRSGFHTSTATSAFVVHHSSLAKQFTHYLMVNARERAELA
jgi:hypothetical protein